MMMRNAQFAILEIMRTMIKLSSAISVGLHATRVAMALRMFLKGIGSVLPALPWEESIPET